ncbi:tRNA (adenosine(37)-N6)-threonylcarbamoyltransferase complex dimerization subunit type 1 TsaB [Bifidobacterium sp. ESL0775]|uniref:tRNA (adenosine(37)-N6)-threonylcarbamoyltransferase complex dimerization subunit type 1 TsaB n=1 Tax=Bifidobacterium sp. ESL0775 TaxID=2983230 RepID=UPI0023F6197D|nr:tRNA (adenosine(37)-N6)-threonylcarbamoyltransferase complex dimerization subunit type 1 TsaB [Bifidobacterium sp. ESL0775]WEV68516.1 tRNA (adenosine(37)-N6)-threonylcarbamoyltransferase complex dimerization subunit type 1 TsaB [Bifidobacterium sp. ESL0775]
MTNTLVIDTSFGSTVGVLGHEPIVETDSRTHVERLQVNVGKAVEQAGLEPKDLDRIVVGVGPAPFTGLRAGVVAAKAMAYATDAQLIGVDVLEPQAWMMRLKRHGDTRLAGCGFLRQVVPDAKDDNVRHLTLAVNDARRRQLYFALYADEPMDVKAGVSRTQSSDDEHRESKISTVVGMDIDYPQHIVERISQAIEGFSTSERRYLIDVVGHGTAKYAEAWQAFGEALGCVIDASVLDAGAAGLDIFADCALSSNGLDAHSAASDKTNGDEDRIGSIKPVEPLYLRRPDVSVPNPLKHVLNHAGATKA